MVGCILCGIWFVGKQSIDDCWVSDYEFLNSKTNWRACVGLWDYTRKQYKKNTSPHAIISILIFALTCVQNDSNTDDQSFTLWVIIQPIWLFSSRCQWTVVALLSHVGTSSLMHWLAVEHLLLWPSAAQYGANLVVETREVLIWLGGLLAGLRAGPLLCAPCNNSMHPCKSVGDFSPSHR